MYIKTRSDDMGSGGPKSESLSGNIESLDWNKLMVEIRKLCFKYDSKGFIDKLNMSVPKSAMYVNILEFKNLLIIGFYLRYGLLGPSGCGKTTLLRLILGKRSLQKIIIKLLIIISLKA